jgi:hypothetical protein
MVSSAAWMIAPLVQPPRKLCEALEELMVASKGQMGCEALALKPGRLEAQHM